MLGPHPDLSFREALFTHGEIDAIIKDLYLLINNLGQMGSTLILSKYVGISSRRIFILCDISSFKATCACKALTAPS